MKHSSVFSLIYWLVLVSDTRSEFMRRQENLTQVWTKRASCKMHITLAFYFQSISILWNWTNWFSNLFSKNNYILWKSSSFSNFSSFFPVLFSQAGSTVVLLENTVSSLQTQSCLIRKFWWTSMLYITYASHYSARLKRKKGCTRFGNLRMPR